MRRHESWALRSETRHRIHTPASRGEPLPAADGSGLLPYGLGRSYGDSCLNDGGTLIDTRRLDHLLDFDGQRGVLRCESGTRLSTLLRTFVPRGWFPVVTPGTKHVTVGGAIANDVHGKNHHRAGTFGRHVLRLELRRSDGRVLECSPETHGELFRATIGGLGLTGLITWAELQLVRIASPWIDQESVRFDGLDEFFELAEASDRRFDHTVAWIDGLARGGAPGRGLLLRGGHAGPDARARPRGERRTVRIPFPAPAPVLNRFTIGAFNALRRRAQRGRVARSRVHFDPFFYPLDSLDRWDRLYGPRGFFQHQSVIPPEAERDGIRALLARTARRGDEAFLVVLKRFGDLPSPGLMSFPRAGSTLALDLPHRGAPTLALLEELDAIVRDHGGRVYPAKDARMSARSFRAFFPRWEEFARHVDPAFSSGFWRRVTA